MAINWFARESRFTSSNHVKRRATDEKSIKSMEDFMSNIIIWCIVVLVIVVILYPLNYR